MEIKLVPQVRTNNVLFVECKDCGWDGILTELEIVKNQMYCPECGSKKVNSY